MADLNSSNSSNSGSNSNYKKVGWLEKEGHLAKSWKRRWFVLQDGHLTYFEDRNCSKLLGTIPLKGCQVSDPKSGRAGRYAWRISTIDAKESKYIISAETKQVMEDWKSAIREEAAIAATRATIATTTSPTTLLSSPSSSSLVSSNPSSPRSIHSPTAATAAASGSPSSSLPDSATSVLEGTKSNRMSLRKTSSLRKASAPASGLTAATGTSNAPSFFNSNNNNTMDSGSSVNRTSDGNVAASPLGAKLLSWFHTSSDAAISTVLELFDASDMEKVVPAVLRLKAANGTALGFLKSLAIKEVSMTTQESTLFRRNSIATRCFSAYALDVGQKQLKCALEKALTYVCTLGTRVEVDPCKLGPSVTVASMQESQRLLRIAAQQVLDAVISDGIERSGLRRIGLALREPVEKKFPGSGLKVVGGLFFLRYVVPAVTAPDAYNIIDPPISVASRRALILVAKLLQNLANDVEFGSKETYLIPLNGFIKDNKTTMTKFLDMMSSNSSLDLLTIDEDAAAPEEKYESTDEQTRDDVNCIFKCSFRIHEKIQRLIDNPDNEIFRLAIISLLDLLLPLSRSSMNMHAGGQDRSYFLTDGGDSCFACSINLNVSFRKDHCRRCGHLFCAGCVRFKMRVPERGKIQETKVCKECFDYPPADNVWIDAKLVWKADALFQNATVNDGTANDGSYISSSSNNSNNISWSLVKYKEQCAVHLAELSSNLISVRGEETFAMDAAVAVDAIWNVTKRKHWDVFFSSEVESLGYGGCNLRVFRCTFPSKDICPALAASSELVLAESLRRLGNVTRVVLFSQFMVESLRKSSVILDAPSEFVITKTKDKECKVSYTLTANVTSQFPSGALKQLLIHAVEQVHKLKMLETPDLLVDGTAPIKASSSSSAAAARTLCPSLEVLREECSSRSQLCDALGWSVLDLSDESPECRIESQSELSGDEVFYRISTWFGCDMFSVLSMLWPLEVVALWDHGYIKDSIHLLDTFAQGEVMLQYRNHHNPESTHLLYRQEKTTERENGQNTEIISFTPDIKPHTSSTRGAVFIDKIVLSTTPNGCRFIRTLQMHSGSHNYFEWAAIQKKSITTSLQRLEQSMIVVNRRSSILSAPLMLVSSHASAAVI